MKLYIKNMVCNCCKMVVKSEMEKIGLKPTSVDLSEVEIKDKPAKEQINTLSIALNHLGFELLDDRKQNKLKRSKN